MMEKATAWLWQNRKVVITVALFAAVTQLLYFLPFYLLWWVSAGILILAAGTWWIVGFSRDTDKWWPLLVEVCFLAAAGLGLAVFEVVDIFGYEVLSVALLGVLFWVLQLYQAYIEGERWPVQAFTTLNFLDLVAFFLGTGAMLTIIDFYHLPLWVIMLVFGLLVLFVVYVRFWRESSMTLRKWFYALLTLLVLEEVLWVLSSWHRGVYFKSFLMAIIFYAFVDFITHYTRGTLTVKVAVEYSFLILIMLAAIFVFDWLFILQ